MASKLSIDRRSAVFGGAAVALTGCEHDSSGNGTTYASPPSGSSSGNWVAEELGHYLIIGAVAASAGSFVAGLVGISRLARTLNRVSAFSRRANSVVGAINAINSLRSASPAQARATPTYRPNNIVVNGFSNVPIVGPKIDLDIGIIAEKGDNLANYDIHTSVLPADRGVPQTVAQAQGNGDFPYATTEPSLYQRYWNRKLPITLPFAEAYAYYCWKVPKGTPLTNYVVANQAYIGPTFVAMNQSDVRRISNEIAWGQNVQASFKIT